MSRPVLLSALLMGLIASLPVLYLHWVWPTVPELVPTHFGANGVPDHFTGRQWLWNVAWLPAVAFAVFTFLPQVHAGQSFFWSSYQQRQLRGLVVGGSALFVLMMLHFSIRDGKSRVSHSASSAAKNHCAQKGQPLITAGLFARVALAK